MWSSIDFCILINDLKGFFDILSKIFSLRAVNKWLFLLSGANFQGLKSNKSPWKLFSNQIIELEEQFLLLKFITFFILRIVYLAKVCPTFDDPQSNSLTGHFISVTKFWKPCDMKFTTNFRAKQLSTKGLVEKW